MSLTKKYKLDESEPTEDQKKSWLSRTLSYIKNGISEEEAGKLAAMELFKSYGAMIIKSQADSVSDLIEELKREMKKKGKGNYVTDD